MSIGETNRHLHLVVNNDSISSTGQPGLVEPVELTQFPDIPETSDGITPEIAQQFVRASREHFEAGDRESVLGKLAIFPDKNFAANIALNLGEESKDTSLLDLATDLDSSEQMAHRAGAAAIRILLADSPRSTADDSEKQNEPSAKTEENESQHAKAEIEPLSQQEIDEIHEELNRLDADVGATKTATEEARAMAIYDERAIKLVDRAASTGDTGLALHIVHATKTSSGEARAMAIYDERTLEHIKEVATSGDIRHAEELSRTLFTSSGEARAMAIIKNQDK